MSGITGNFANLSGNYSFYGGECHDDITYNFNGNENYNDTLPIYYYKCDDTRALYRNGDALITWQVYAALGAVWSVSRSDKSQAKSSIIINKISYE